jgi:hypothetical protein
MPTLDFSPKSKVLKIPPHKTTPIFSPKSKVTKIYQAQFLAQKQVCPKSPHTQKCAPNREPATAATTQKSGFNKTRIISRPAQIGLLAEPLKARFLHESWLWGDLKDSV